MYVHFKRAYKYGHPDVPTQDNMYMGIHYTGLSGVQISLLRRFVSRSTRARACRTDCGGGGSIGRLFNPTGAARVRMYTNITCLSREHLPLLPQGWGSLHLTPRSQATWKISNRLHASPSTPLYHRWIVHISSTRWNSPYHCPQKIFEYTFGDAHHLFLPRRQFPSLHGQQTPNTWPRT